MNVSSWVEYVEDERKCSMSTNKKACLASVVVCMMGLSVQGQTILPKIIDYKGNVVPYKSSVFGSSVLGGSPSLGLGQAVISSAGAPAAVTPIYIPAFGFPPWNTLNNSINKPWIRGNTEAESHLTGQNNVGSFLYIIVPNYIDSLGKPLLATVTWQRYSLSWTSGDFAFSVNLSEKLVMPQFENAWTTYSVSYQDWGFGVIPETEKLGWSVTRSAKMDEKIRSVRVSITTPEPFVIRLAVNGAAVKVSWSPLVYPGLRLYVATSVTGPWVLETAPVNTVLNGFNYIIVPTAEQFYRFWKLAP